MIGRKTKQGVFIESNLDCANCGSKEWVCSYTGECDNLEPMTNEDWLRQASSEELAEWIVDEIKNMAYSFLLKEFSNKDCKVLHGYYCEWLKEKRK